MQVQDLNGNTYKWKFIEIAKPVSKLCNTAIKIVQDIYPNVRVFTDVPIKINASKRLYIDIYIPAFNLAIEVNGPQHTEVNDFFHANYREFLKQQINDNNKKSWCELNNVPLIYLNYNESEHEWRSRIISATKPSSRSVHDSENGDS